MLGASNLTYAEATWTQALPDWIGAHTRAFATFDGGAAMVVSDNLKSAMIRACFYEPEVNRSYAEMAAHYGTAILPAAPTSRATRRRSRSAVLLATLDRRPTAQPAVLLPRGLNAAIRGLRRRLNARAAATSALASAPLRDDRAPSDAAAAGGALRPCRLEQCHGGLDYHVQLEGHHYSVPHELIRQTIWARLTASTVEIFRRGKRVAAHVRASWNAPPR